MAFTILHVRNGRELATMLYERIAGTKFTMDFSPIGRAWLPAVCYVCSLYHFTTNRVI